MVDLALKAEIVRAEVYAADPVLTEGTARNPISNINSESDIDRYEYSFVYSNMNSYGHEVLTLFSDDDLKMAKIGFRRCGSILGERDADRFGFESS